MKENEIRHIQGVYAARDASPKSKLYAWYRPEIQQQQAAIDRHLSAFLGKVFKGDLSDKLILDVGCGTGGFLRKMLEWGAMPENLVGTELLSDRLAEARRRSPSGIFWHLGELNDLDAEKSFDLAATFTVFSSILDPGDRQELAMQLWDRLRPGGWVVVFDFRVNNPYNREVRKVTLAELKSWWQPCQDRYSSLILAPPISRFLTPRSYILSELIASCCPFLRTHFIYAAQKKVGNE